MGNTNTQMSTEKMPSRGREETLKVTLPNYADPLILNVWIGDDEEGNELDDSGKVQSTVQDVVDDIVQGSYFLPPHRSWYLYERTSKRIMDPNVPIADIVKQACGRPHEYVLVPDTASKPPSIQEQQQMLRQRYPGIYQPPPSLPPPLAHHLQQPHPHPQPHPQQQTQQSFMSDISYANAVFSPTQAQRTYTSRSVPLAGSDVVAPTSYEYQEMISSHPNIYDTLEKPLTAMAPIYQSPPPPPSLPPQQQQQQQRQVYQPPSYQQAPYYQQQQQQPSYSYQQQPPYYQPQTSPPLQQSHDVMDDNPDPEKYILGADAELSPEQAQLMLEQKRNAKRMGKNAAAMAAAAATPASQEMYQQQPYGDHPQQPQPLTTTKGGKHFFPLETDI